MYLLPIHIVLCMKEYTMNKYFFFNKIEYDLKGHGRSHKALLAKIF